MLLHSGDKVRIKTDTRRKVGTVISEGMRGAVTYVGIKFIDILKNSGTITVSIKWVPEYELCLVLEEK